MYARRVGDRELTFDFGEGLIENNLLIVDRETTSVWSQLEGSAVSGPMKGTPLEVVPALQTTWKFWRQRHPETRVWIDGKAGRPYLYRNRAIGTPRPKTRPTTHDASALGLGLAFGGEAIFLPFEALTGAPLPLGLEVGGEHVRVHYRKEELTAWAEDPEGNLLPHVLAYRSGWLSFHPESRIYTRAP